MASYNSTVSILEGHTKWHCLHVLHSYKFEAISCISSIVTSFGYRYLPKNVSGFMNFFQILCWDLIIRPTLNIFALGVIDSLSSNSYTGHHFLHWPHLVHESSSISWFQLKQLKSRLGMVVFSCNILFSSISSCTDCLMIQMRHLKATQTYASVYWRGCMR